MFAEDKGFAKGVALAFVLVTLGGACEVTGSEVSRVEFSVCFRQTCAGWRISGGHG
jgi:hypothetical protein